MILVYLHKMFSTRLGQISKDTDKLESFWGEKPGDGKQKQHLIKVKERFQETELEKGLRKRGFRY